MTIPLIICGARTAVLLYFGEEIIAEVVLESLKLSYMVTVPLTILVAVNLIDPIIAPGTHKDIIDVEE
jgi:Fe2+ transport system protein B